MHVFGLAVAGMLALSTPMMGHAAPLGSSMKQVVPASDIVPVWGGCGWAGTRCPAIGAGGEDGFRRTAHQAITMDGGVPMVTGIMPMAGPGSTVPRMTGTRSGIPLEAGEDPRVAGVILSQNQTGLTPGYLRRVGLRVSAICCARVALR